MAITISSPEAAVAATPYLIGFTPKDSFVLLLCDENALRMSMRVDLPPMADLGWLQSVLAGVPDPVPNKAVLIVYADTVAADIAEALGDWVMFVLGPVMSVLDVVLVHEGHVNSLTGQLEAAGSRIPLSVLENHPVVAELVGMGMSTVGQREDLVAQLSPVTDAMTHQVRAALDEPVRVGNYEQHRDLMERRALAVLDDCEPLTPADVMCLGRACSDWHIRDPLISILLARVDEDRRALHHVRARLRYAVVHLPAEFAAPAAATLALLSWADGDGAAALVAADRALEADECNTLAPLVIQALQNGLPPETWASLTHDIPMEVLRGHVRRSA